MLRNMLSRLAPLFVIGALAMPLGGCDVAPQLVDLSNKVNAIAGYSITQDQFDAVRSGYKGTFLALAANYRELGRCAPGTSFSISNRCRDNDVVRQLRTTDAKILDMFNKVQAQLDAGNTEGALALYATLKTTINTAISLVSQYT